MTPLTHPAKKIDQVDNDNNNLGESNMITEKVINDPFQTFGNINSKNKNEDRNRNRNPNIILLEMKMELKMISNRN